MRRTKDGVPITAKDTKEHTLGSVANRRIRVLESCGARAGVIDELLAYGEQPCRWPPGTDRPAFPLDDEPQVAAWQRYEDEARELGALPALQRHLVQLQFPVRAGMSGEDAYRDATRKGRVDAADAFAPGLELRHPDALRIEVMPTIAGRLPLLVCGDRADFEALVQALTARNEPEPVPAAMGACLVKGLNNWSRVADYRASWEAAHPHEHWADEFQRMIPRKELYQDRLIILSTGPYSATAAADVGLDPREWLDRSLVIRRDHELTHYFVYRLFGVMRSHAFDEVVADFIGTGRAFGRFRPDLALRFLGLEAFPSYRAGGRLEMYRADPPLTDAAAEVVRALVWRSIAGLSALTARWTPADWDDLGRVAALLFSVSQLTLEELASPDLADLVSAPA